ncbi:unnamed protein product [Cyprideis torosa]|uniref:Uncharacterized protein n=1 Tax=Cyprideis torosa TaxID=163714 RepID=A0A7R8ZUA4_9CRUS|nr:unnamed protein product [Cyprideis torosa]CAG0899961.1 unnamed protein product [Cyprideis torosa]
MEKILPSNGTTVSGQSLSTETRSSLDRLILNSDSHQVNILRELQRQQSWLNQAMNQRNIFRNNPFKSDEAIVSGTSATLPINLRGTQPVEKGPQISTMRSSIDAFFRENQDVQLALLTSPRSRNVSTEGSARNDGGRRMPTCELGYSGGSETSVTVKPTRRPAMDSQQQQQQNGYTQKLKHETDLGTLNVNLRVDVASQVVNKYVPSLLPKNKDKKETSLDTKNVIFHTLDAGFMEGGGSDTPGKPSDKSHETLVLMDDRIFIQLVCDAHNIIRRMHGVPELTVRSKLVKSAAEAANINAFEDDINAKRSSAKNKEYGENRYFTKLATDINPVPATAAVKKWYAQEEIYRPHYGKIPPSNIRKLTHHFTQVVWKGTKHIGVGRAQGRSGTWYVVVHYWPPGNKKSEYPHQVLPRLISDGSRDTPTPQAAGFNKPWTKELLQKTLKNGLVRKRSYTTEVEKCLKRNLRPVSMARGRDPCLEEKRISMQYKKGPRSHQLNKYQPMLVHVTSDGSIELPASRTLVNDYQVQNQQVQPFWIVNEAERHHVTCPTVPKPLPTKMNMKKYVKLPPPQSKRTCEMGNVRAGGHGSSSGSCLSETPSPGKRFHNQPAVCRPEFNEPQFQTYLFNNYYRQPQGI